MDFALFRADFQATARESSEAVRSVDPPRVASEGMGCERVLNWIASALATASINMVAPAKARTAALGFLWMLDKFRTRHAVRPIKTPARLVRDPDMKRAVPVPIATITIRKLPIDLAIQRPMLAIIPAPATRARPFG